MYRGKDNIKMGLGDVGWVVDWIDLAQDRDRWRVVVKVAMEIKVT